MIWLKLNEMLPETDGKNSVPCLVVYRNKVRIFYFNPVYLCWDDETGDNFFKLTEVKYWMPLPPMPTEAVQYGSISSHSQPQSCLYS